MEFQVDTNNYRTLGVRIGLDNRAVANFRKTSFFIHNLQAQFEGLDYQLKLAAPWNGFRFQLRQDDRVLAQAKRNRRMHAFEEDRPLIRHQVIEFEIVFGVSSCLLTPEDRHGLNFVLREAENEIGRLSQRSFEEQQGAEWKADLFLPDEWSVPGAAFVAWLAREGRARMSA